MDATRNKKFKLGSTTLIILPSPIRTNGTKWKGSDYIIITSQKLKN